MQYAGERWEPWNHPTEWVERIAMPTIECTPLASSELDAATDVLVRSFAADPGLLFVLPDDAARKRLGPTLAQIMLRFVLRCGAPLVTTSPVRGIALWFPPGAHEPNREDFVETGMTDVPDLIGAKPWARFKWLIDQLDALHPKCAPDPHWYLAMLGVDPDWQRRGIGEALLQPVFESSDRDKVPCYLEAPTIENVRYYERRGFRVAAEIDIPDSDVHVWCMRRDPVT